jgi:hypothetical protein
MHLQLYALTTQCDNTQLAILPHALHADLVPVATLNLSNNGA